MASVQLDSNMKFNKQSAIFFGNNSNVTKSCHRNFILTEACHKICCCDILCYFQGLFNALRLKTVKDQILKVFSRNISNFSQSVWPMMATYWKLLKIHKCFLNFVARCVNKQKTLQVHLTFWCRSLNGAGGGDSLKMANNYFFSGKHPDFCLNRICLWLGIFLEVKNINGSVSHYKDKIILIW